MATRFVPNPAGLRELNRSREMQAAMAREAEEVADAARALAPQDEGDYVASIGVEVTADAQGVKAQAVATDWKAGFIEFGTVDTPTFAPLRRGAEQAGHRVEDRGPRG